MIQADPALLALEDGTIFEGKAIGAMGESIGEVVFNTSMTGYQEILTDPSYKKQIVNFTYPHIGNVGINAEDDESSHIHASGIIVRDLALDSHWRAKFSLNDFLIKHHLTGIAGIDTRALTRKLRTQGALRGCIQAIPHLNTEQAIQKARNFSGLDHLDLAKEVSVPSSYRWSEGLFEFDKNAFKTYVWEKLPYHVVVYDFGVKRNILRLLVEQGCRLTVVPATTSPQEVLALKPNGIFLSNGPGDPAACDYAIRAIQKFLEKNIPLFGICLGFQLLALACGARTFKMKFGHHGANHPVINLLNQKVSISSQNHSFAVSEEIFPEHLQITKRSLFDQTIQEIWHRKHPAFAFQGHPEAGPGPHDLKELFAEFKRMMEKNVLLFPL